MNKVKVSETKDTNFEKARVTSACEEVEGIEFELIDCVPIDS
jgi:hypothetical protein